eukprot:2017838-Heterocapsa_arctica.AAC.1
MRPPAASGTPARPSRRRRRWRPRCAPARQSSAASSSRCCRCGPTSRWRRPWCHPAGRGPRG